MTTQRGLGRLDVTVLGCSGSYAAPDGACTGYLVRGGDTNVLLDCGPGTLANLQHHLPIRDLDAVVITHSHPEWLAARWLDRHGFEATERWVQFNNDTPRLTLRANTLRTTPSEMAQIYVDLEQCSQGTGVLLEKYGENLTAARCTEMIGWLETNGDHTRMLSGLPRDAKVAHKSGWIPPEIQADAGIVRSPGGDFVLSVYLYQPGERYSDAAVKSLLGSVARLVYTYYNPIPLTK